MNFSLVTSLLLGSGLYSNALELRDDSLDVANGQQDYVIVGGGPAGFVLAEQLSRNPNVSVTLLLAGPDGTDAKSINVPVYAPNNVETQYVWNYTSQPDPNIEKYAPDLTQGHTFGGGKCCGDQFLATP
jgi:choline dehydrogenase-like flavoprotein